MDRMYIDSQSSSFYNDMLKKCMGKGHKTPKYLFNPRITEEWKEGELWLLVSIIGVYKKVVSIMKIVF